MLKLNLIIFLLGVAASDSVTYTIKTITGSRAHEGTDSTISIALSGLKSENPVFLGVLDNPGNDFERNALNTFTVTSDVDVGRIRCAILKIDGGDAWKVNTVIVTSSSMEEDVHVYNQDDVWMSGDSSEGVDELELCSQGWAIYRVQAKTADVAHAGTDEIHAKITMYNKDSSKNATSGFLDNRDKNDFVRGEEDVFNLYNMVTFSGGVRCITVTAGSDDAWLFDWIKVEGVRLSGKNKGKKKAGQEVTFYNTDKVWLSSDTSEGSDELELCRA